MIAVFKAKLGRRFRALGWVDGLLLSLKRVLTRISGGRCTLIKYVLVAQPVPDENWLPPRRGRGVTIRHIQAPDPALDRFPRPADVYDYRFRQGAECFVCERDAGQPAGFIWLTLHDYHEDEVRCVFRPEPRERTAWDFDVYVGPEHRMSPVFLRMWDAANAYLRVQGVQWCVSRVDAFNTGSMAAHRRLGAAPVGWCVFVVLGRGQITVSSRHPWLHLSFGESRKPVMTIDVETLQP